MQDTVVSILITYYNQMKYVDRAINSVLSQKIDFNIQIIVGDDGSDDGTQDAVMRWIEKYPELIEIHIMERKDAVIIPGFRASRNRLNLLKYVKGTYFIFLDGDDYFIDPNKLAKQVNILNNIEYKNCSACAHSITKILQNNTKEILNNRELKAGVYTAKTYWPTNYFHTNTLLMRSSLIPLLPMDKIYNHYNDNMITFLALQHGDIYYLTESMAAYNQTGDGIWTSKNIIINSIRNIYLYDLANQIEPSLKKETRCKFGPTWINIFKHRKEIDSNHLEPYKIEAIDEKFDDAFLWLSYSNIPILKKFYLWRQTAINATYYYIAKILSIMNPSIRTEKERE